MELSAKHLTAIELLISGSKTTEVGKALDIRYETVSRWKSEPEFQSEMNKRLGSIKLESQNRLNALTGTALTTIEQVMTDEDCPHRERLNAALKILELTRLKPTRIGSTNAAILKSEQEQSDLLESYQL